MRASILFSIASLFFLSASCQDSSPQENASPEQDAGTTVRLSSEQLEMAGIELGLPERRTIAQQLEVTGRVHLPPSALVSVYSPVLGFVQQVEHIEGDYVRAGTPLTVLRHPGIIQLQEDYLAGRIRLQQLAQNLERQLALAKTQASSQRILEEAQADYRTQALRTRSQRQQLEMIGLPVDKLESNNETVPQLIIAAPVSGYLTKVVVNRGKLAEGDDLLFELADYRHLHAELDVYAEDIALLKEGLPVELYQPGRERQYLGEIFKLAKSIDLEQRTARVHVHFRDQPKELIVGSPLRARILYNAREVLALPESAILREGSTTLVYIEHQGSYRPRTIDAGPAHDGFIAVEGLQLADGEQIVVEGAYYLHGG